MCVIERKTYYHTNGREETVEKTRPCHRAVGNRLCKYVERRSFETARIIETKPSSSSSTPLEKDRDGHIIIEGSRGQQRMYRDLSKRSSNSSSIRRSATMSERITPVSTPSSASSPSYVEVKPEAPSTPPAAPSLLYGERTRTPYRSSKPRPTFTKDGTAIYERAPSLDNERPKSKRLEEESSFSRITAEVDDTVEPTLSQRRRTPSISIDTTARPPTPSSATISSPGLSQLKSALRRDSAKDVKRKSSLRYSSDSDRQRRKERQEEDDRQARLQREDLAQSDRHQSTREKLVRDASRERRERHRREAADALEGARERDDPISRGREAERAEMQRERERAAQLRREDDLSRQYIDDQLRRDADARMRSDAQQQQRYQPQPQPSRMQPRPASSSSSPIASLSPTTSARAFGNTNTSMQPMQPLPMQPPRVHQYPPPGGQTLSERGADVIARERARAAGQSLNDALAGMSVQDRQEREAEEYQARMGERYGPGVNDGRYRYGGAGSGRRYR